MGFEVLQQLAPLCDHSQQPTPGAVIFQVRFEMFREIGDTPAQDSNLYFWRTAVIFVNPILRDDLFLDVLRQCHPFE
jgi:hypothetical protein